MVKAAKQRSSLGAIWMVAGVGVLFVGGLIGLSIWSSNSRQQKAAEAAVVVPTKKADAEMLAQGRTQGKPEAKAELIEYGDFL